MNKIKKFVLFQKKNVKATNIPKTVSSPKPEKSHNVIKVRRRKIRPQRRYRRGIVYLGHIPHGFYEEQMTKYFTQFGKVTRVRVVRSRNVSIHEFELYMI